MATRAIITHQPEVSCDMCGRRLLRGERPDTFLAAGSRRTVCELCVPRAAGEGWTRASEARREPDPHAPRAGRGRSLLSRLRQRRELEDDRVGGEDDHAAEAWRPEALDAWQDAPAEGWLQRHQQPGEDETRFDDEQWMDSAIGPDQPAMELDDDGLESVHAAPERPLSVDLTLEQAIEIFNASECAGRVAGIARALGQPTVTVNPHPDDHDRAIFVVAWELCWYRYEVDLRERPATIALIGEGTELHELGDEDRLGNAAADERGELSLR
jgi:hypothetical protein